MKIALAQMKMNEDMNENLEKCLEYCDMSRDCDLLFFPEIQLSPFFLNIETEMSTGIV